MTISISTRRDVVNPDVLQAVYDDPRPLQDFGAVAASPARVASIVEYRSQPAFVLLLKLADRYFADPGFQDALARSLRENPAVVRSWEIWSAEKRWAPSAYLDGTEVGWFDGARRNIRVHPDRAAAVADLIRRLAAWLSRREVVDA
ncbi:hypothetical protein [Asanoa siamensis]|uniref:Uncharacterized protein n=1 Tax=Asanoa siamensis TaxID=926357 RepID=A0ABQ4CTE8_9ACTN|nr:hypothetical protein [Asanoa siamensis]GIF74552.1 hypothetical protein Asi02nite_40700 [Asanoa siamensis]